MKTSRREFLALASAAIGASQVGSKAAMSAGDFQIDSLKTDGLRTPLGLESMHPRLSWTLVSPSRGFEQRQYRVLVSSDPAALSRGHADLWDSGLRTGNETFDIAYAGVPLQSRQRCWWQVQAYGKDGTQAISPVSWWEMGLLRDSDWCAQWIAAETLQQRDDRAAGLHWIWTPIADSDDQSHGFRFRFDVSEIPRKTTLLAVARDVIEGIWINGVPTARQSFKPGVVNNARVESIPISLRSGTNVLAIQAALRPKGFPKTPSGGLAALLRLEFPDGRVERLVTGSAWTTQPAPAEGWQQAESGEGFRPALEASSKPRFDPWPAEPAIHLRRSFVVPARVEQARLYITALGAYEVTLNGARVGDQYLAPESSDFSKRVLYRALDVSALVSSGENVLGVTVGDGWYGSTGLFVGRYAFGPAPNRLLAQLEIRLVDGTAIVCSSSPEWRLAQSPILASEIYDGEVFDARVEIPGWDVAGFDDSSWSRAYIADRPSANVVAEVSPPVRVVATLRPVSISRSGEAWVADFGQNFAGWCVICAHAARGTTITLRFAEVLKPNGGIDTSNLRSAAAEDFYTFRGSSDAEVFRPHFTYHGFRYVEISGWEGALSDDFIVGEALSSDLPLTGALRTDDALIGRIVQNAWWSQRSNFIGIPTDCPQRDERLGWMGDAQVFWDAAGFTMDVDAFTRRFMGDVRDAQARDGTFAEFNPQSDNGVMHSRGAPGWADAGVLLPWSVWWRYGDTGIIHDNWDAMMRYADHVADRNPDFIWSNDRGSDYGDWLALDAKEPGDPTTPKDLVATAMWADVSLKLAQLAAAIGRSVDAARYHARHQRIRSAFIRRFVGADGRVGNGSQTSYILALRFGLLPAPLRGAASRNLATDIRARGTVLATGFLGTPHALDVLADCGQVDLVYRLLERTDYPSWGYMVRHGATTMWERWNGDTGDVAMNSYNHYAFGAIVGFLYRRIAGIEALAPGFRRARIHPLLDGSVTQAGATYESIAGRYRTDWSKNSDGSVDLKVTVPPNTRAEVYLRAGMSRRYQEGRSDLHRSRHIKTLARHSDGLVLEVGSGDYEFRSS
jgi:alpha-L-rhamnosidase